MFSMADFVALAEAAHKEPMAGRTVQHRLKLTEAVALWESLG